MSNISASSIMSSYLSKTQVNNFITYTPPKSHYIPTGTGTNESTRDFSIKPFSQYSPSGSKYPPELDSFRREVNDQIRNVVYSLTSDMKAMKKENSDYRYQIDELRREIESANSKILQYKASYNAEINSLKNSVLSSHEADQQHSKPNNNDTLKNNWTPIELNRPTGDSVNEMREINTKIAQISRQIHTINEELEGIKRFNYVPKEQFNRSLVDIVDELERKLNIINDRVRERIEDMDASLVDSLKDKNRDIQKLHNDIRSIQTSVIRVNDQVNTYTHSSEMNLEDQVRKIMNNYSTEIRNISTIANSTEQKLRMMKKDEVSVTSPLLLNSSFQPYQGDEVKAKLRELDTIYQSVSLLEKEVRAKTDMVDLNINSIKRNLELELSIQLKHMVLPIQKSVEQYLQTSEGRFVALEDAVLNHMKRDSYVMTADRANRFRSSAYGDENTSFIPRPQFENISSIDPSAIEERFERKPSNPELLRGGTSSGPGSRTGFREKSKDRERQSQETFKIEEVDSVVSMSDVLRSTWKHGGDNNNNRNNERYGEMRMDQLQIPTSEGSNDIHREHVRHNSEEEREEVLTTIAKKVLPDKDKNKRQESPSDLFGRKEPAPQVDTGFRDFPSTSAMKAHMDLERHEQKKQSATGERSSSKKKRPEIEVGEVAKDNSKEKKLSLKSSPINLDSKLILNTEGFGNEDEITPPVHQRGGKEKEKERTKSKDSRDKSREKSKEISVEAEEEIPQEFHGNIKGLLRKSRNKKDNTPSLEELDSERNRANSPLRGRYEEPKQNNTNSLNKKSPLPNNKGLDNKPVLGGKKQQANNNDNMKNSGLQKSLPPVDTKSVKNFNKGQKELPPPRPQSGNRGGFNNNQQQQTYNQRQQPGGYYQGGYDDREGWRNPQGGPGEEEGESVEEVVYHVDEEGFLVDEAGNYLVDEQGNFLQLSPDQMKEIEENDLVYEKEF